MNTLETTLKELSELGYTPEEIRNAIEEMMDRIDQYTDGKAGNN